MVSVQLSLLPVTVPRKIPTSVLIAKTICYIQVGSWDIPKEQLIDSPQEFVEEE
jgi:hypothetical protein